VWCPLKDLKLLVTGRDVQPTIRVGSTVSYFKVTAMNYLCHPDSMDDLNPYEFYSKYELVKYLDKAFVNGPMSFLYTPNFMHPSFHTTTAHHEGLLIKGKKP
jgi:hypothetical protein